MLAFAAIADHPLDFTTFVREEEALSACSVKSSLTATARSQSAGQGRQLSLGSRTSHKQTGYDKGHVSRLRKASKARKSELLEDAVAAERESWPRG